MKHTITSGKFGPIEIDIPDGEGPWLRYTWHVNKMHNSTDALGRPYLTVATHKSVTKCGSRKLARLVCEHFHGAAPLGSRSHCRHLNGNPRDNRPENLAWGTCRQNLCETKKHSVRPAGVTWSELHRKWRAKVRQLNGQVKPGRGRLFDSAAACHWYCQQLRREYGIPELVLTNAQLEFLASVPDRTPDVGGGYSKPSARTAQGKEKARQHRQRWISSPENREKERRRLRELERKRRADPAVREAVRAAERKRYAAKKAAKLAAK